MMCKILNSNFSIIVFAVFVIFIAGCESQDTTQSLTGQALPTAAPEEVGLSSERLRRIDKVMLQYVDEKLIPGAVTLVARRGKVAHFEAFGMMDIENNKPMQKDTIFRLASMTKQFTSLAVMMLYEEGHFLLSDPISKFIPEFKNPKVFVPSSSGDSYELIPAKSEITIRQLLNHTSGITYGYGTPVEFNELSIKAGIMDKNNNFIDFENNKTLDDLVKKLPNVPLMNHPGEEFIYGFSTDVLGYLVEIVSGMTLNEFFNSRIFQPLDMTDTYYSVPDEKILRFMLVYEPTENGDLHVLDDPWSPPSSFYMGSSGLCSTVSDYAQFLQMILNGGELSGVRLVSRKTIELMTSNSIGDLYIKIPGVPLRATSGDKSGLGFYISTERGQYDELESIGTVANGGGFYTYFFIDPKEDLFGIFMSQVDPIDHLDLWRKFRILVEQAIVD
ncbi:serine hydrolase domain-containing protein [Candidatus Latescibacterota bacterium]